MNDTLQVLVPTRLRPHTLRPMLEAFAGTCAEETLVVFCIDGCPKVDDYIGEFHRAVRVYDHAMVLAGPRRRLVGTLNYHAVNTANNLPPYAIGYMGDDHRPITKGWDRRYLETLHELGTGIVYGDDQAQGAGLPTQVAMTSDIIAALGYMVAPTLTHMYCDNYWKVLGEGADCIRYLPDVVIRHNHPGFGRGEWDDSYRESNSARQYEDDLNAFREYQLDQLPADIETVVNLRSSR